ncbi:MAG: metal ABC transporter ATP-binding protein [Patescibacteria group bacterium]
MEALLTVDQVGVKFERDVLKNVSFDLYKGEVLAIIGPNGAGKSVLLRALLGLIPYSGTILWKKDVRIGYVPQRMAVEQDLPLSVREFFSFKKAHKGTISEVLKAVGLNGEKILNQRLGTLSGGQLQRVMIGWSLIDHPDVLFYDEPTTGIDAGGEEAIYLLLKRLQDEQKLSVVVVSHDLNMVYKYATKVVCINKQMVCFGHPMDVLDSKSLSHLYGHEAGLYEHHHDGTHQHKGQ